VSNISLVAPAEPDLHLWCTPLRLDQLSRELRPALDSLLWAGQLKPVLRDWVRRQLVEEVLKGSPSDPDACDGDQLPPGWSEQLRSQWLQRDAALKRWARQQWGHRLEAMYLARKSQLDRFTFRMLRVSDGDLALELYHRIKAGEAGFEQLSWTFGEGKERFQGGLIKGQRLEALPPAFIPLLQNLRSTVVQEPRQLGKQHVIYQLEKREPSVFDETTSEQLLQEDLARWEAVVVDHLLTHLISSD